MQIVSCPGLEIIQLEDDHLVAKHPVTGACHVLDTPTAALLKLLQDPEDLESLSGRNGPIPEMVIERLLQIGLLVDASAPLARTRKSLRRFQPTFMECPEGEPGSAQVCVVGMPADALSETGSGAAAGPAALRLATSPVKYEVDHQTGKPIGCFDYYTGRRRLAGVTFADLGDIPVRVSESPVDHGRHLNEVVRSCIERGSFPLILGGDHSLTAWSVNTNSDAPLSVLQLDAHSDMGIAPDDSIPTNGSVSRRLLEQPHVKQLLTVGVRGFLPAEQSSGHPGHRIISAAETRRLGAEEIVALLPEDRPCYLTLDVDVLDPSIAPGTNALVPDGLLFAEVRAIVETLGRKRQVIAADIVEVNPSRDPYLLTARAAAHLAMTLLAACFERNEQSDEAAGN